VNRTEPAADRAGTALALGRRPSSRADAAGSRGSWPARASVAHRGRWSRQPWTRRPSLVHIAGRIRCVSTRLRGWQGAGAPHRPAPPKLEPRRTLKCAERVNQLKGLKHAHRPPGRCRLPKVREAAHR